MSEELEALERIKKMYVYFIKHYRKLEPTLMICEKEDFDSVETTLKRLKIYEKYGIDIDETDDVEKALKLNAGITIADKVMNTQERLLTSVSSDEIRILSSVLNSQTKNLKNKLKALEIIKEKIKHNFYLYEEMYRQCDFEERDLLKEVLL